MEPQKSEIFYVTFSRKPRITRDVLLRDPSRDNPTEAAIQALIADGKFEEACASAYCVYRREIVGYCSNQLRGKVSEHRADGEEIAQQVFLEFWKALRASKYKPSKASVRTLIYDIADKRIIGKLRTPNRSIPGRDVEVREFTITDRSYWIPGSYAPALSEKHNSFLRLLKNKGFKEETRTKVGLYAIGTSTTLESNKSHLFLPAGHPATDHRARTRIQAELYRRAGCTRNGSAHGP